MQKTILIVEDNDLNMRLFDDLLQASGYHTLQARNGHDAMLAIRQHRPDLVLMDVQLPGVSGLDITRDLKRDPDLCSIPVIAVTAFAMSGDERKIRESGCDDYVSKPIEVAGFLSTIKKFLP